MTIRFLCEYGPYKVNNTVALSAAEETSLVAQKLASTDLTGGTPYVAPAAKGSGRTDMNAAEFAAFQGLVSGAGNPAITASNSMSLALTRQRLGWFKEPLAPLGNVAAPITPTTSVSAPTITVNAGLTAWNSGKFSFPAGDAKVAGGSYPDYNCCRHQNITTSVLIQHIVAEFDFYGQAFEVYGKKTAAACQIRVVADDQIVHAGRSYSPGGVSGDLIYCLFDLGSFARRRIRVEAVYFYFGGIQSLNVCSIQPVDYSGHPLAIGVGDSYEEGTGSSHQWDAASVMMARRIGLRRYWPSGVGQTGYLANPGGGKTTYRGRVASDVIAYSPDIVFVSGSINDNGQTAAAIGAEAALLYAQIRTALPNAALVVTGVYPYGNPIAQALLNNAALKAACLAAGGVFIDPLADVGGSWITGTGKVGAVANNGNADWATFTDGAHPSYDGHVLFADRKVNALRAALR